MERPIIEIDEERCNGCGQCILDCAEGALAIVNGKAKLISETYCDGLGACLNCPQGALSLKTREAPEFDEAAAMQAKIAREAKPLTPLIPKPVIQEIEKNAERERELAEALRPHLHTWPLQLMLMPRRADYLQNADLLLAAQCSGFALPHIHEDWLEGRVPIIACPKLENREKMVERLSGILEDNDIRSITVLRMSVPCCGLEAIVREAMDKAGKDIPWFAHSVKMR